jgi:hypothetical protein
MHILSYGIVFVLCAYPSDYWFSSVRVDGCGEGDEPRHVRTSFAAGARWPTCQLVSKREPIYYTAHGAKQPPAYR